MGMPLRYFKFQLKYSFENFLNQFQYIIIQKGIDIKLLEMFSRPRWHKVLA